MLNNLQLIRDTDPHNMLAEIDQLPDQLLSAWELGKTQPLGSLAGRTFSRLLIAGMGGSAIAADLIAAWCAPVCSLPVFVHREYGLPEWAQGGETLVIASSHSGNTEETLDGFETARRRGCSLLALCTGGTMEAAARLAGIPVWKFTHAGQPRAAIGFSFGLLLAALSRLGLVPDPEQDLFAAASGMRLRQKSMQAGEPLESNPAKDMAVQFHGRWVVVYGAEHLAPVARRWKGQINEHAKAGAGFEALPEADHNTLAGSLHPAEILENTFHLFLESPGNCPRTLQRIALTRQAMEQAGLHTCTWRAEGNTTLEQIWNAIHFGDYSAFYLSMLYGVDPWDTSVLEAFKGTLKAAGKSA